MGALATLAQAVTGTAISFTPHPMPVDLAPVDVWVLPSDGIQKSYWTINLSQAVYESGPIMEVAMRSAIFTCTEHRYDI
jgi:hypothetical protein